MYCTSMLQFHDPCKILHVKKIHDCHEQGNKQTFMIEIVSHEHLANTRLIQFFLFDTID